MFAVAADGADIATFSAAFGVGEELGGEQGGGAGGAKEYGICFTDVLF